MNEENLKLPIALQLCHGGLVSTPLGTNYPGKSLVSQVIFFPFFFPTVSLIFLFFFLFPSFSLSFLFFFLTTFFFLPCPHYLSCVHKPSLYNSGIEQNNYTEYKWVWLWVGQNTALLTTLVCFRDTAAARVQPFFFLHVVEHLVIKGRT